MNNNFSGIYSIAHECSEYEPIQTVNNLAATFEETEEEDAGCDSCVHFSQSECQIYKREGGY